MKSPIFITGVGQRVGYALTKYFLSVGYPVIGTYRTERASIEELQSLGVDLYNCDFYQPAVVNSLIDQIQYRYQSLRAIIHNASDWYPDKCARPSESVLESMMQIHVMVPYQINQALYPLLLAAPEISKDIIHFTDYIVDKGSKKHIAYAASKAALANLTLSFASLYAPDIKVNSIAPAMLQFNDNDTEDYKQRTLAKSLMPREGGYQEVINAVNFLFDSHYVTGRTIAIDGGRHLK